MAQAGFSRILIYKSDTATSIPVAGNLTNSATGAELAVNTADLRLFTKNSGGSVVELGTNPSSLTLPNGTANGVLYLNGSKVATSGSGFTFSSSAGQIGAEIYQNANLQSFLRIANDSTGAAGDARLYFQNSTNTIDFGLPSTGFTTSGLKVANTAYLYFDGANGFNIGATNGSGLLKFYTGGTTERMRLDSSGNVGIGTASPQTRLHIVTSSDGSQAIFSGSQSTNEQTLLFRNAYYTNNSTAGIAAIGWIDTGSSGGNLTFKTTTNGGGVSGTPTERMRIDSSGNVGIGTASPGCKLDINGIAGWSGNTTGIAAQIVNVTSGINGGGNLRVLSNTSATTDAGGSVSLGGYYSTTAASIDFASIIGAKENSTAGNSAGYFAIGTRPNGGNNTERARITSGGGLWVGTTTRQSTSNHAFIQVVESDWTANFQCNTATAANNLGILINYAGSAPNGTASVFWRAQDNAATRAEIRSNGGLANYQANDVNLSDQRVKKDIKPLGSMWDKFKALEIVTFKYKDQTHDDDNIGVIAQQVESVAPEFIDTDGFGKTPEGEEPLKTVYTTDMYHAAIKALQEAMARIEQLEAKVAVLESK